MKIQKSWTGKTAETAPAKKEQHQSRKTKQAIIHQIEDVEWEQQVREYKKNASQPFQE